jgi:hypothetical protein
MTIDNTREPLGQKSCLACFGVFYICRLCERGQLYCSGPCRGRGRQASNRASNRRYSESFKGKRAASNRQRKLRKQRRNNQHCTISGQDKGSNEGCRSKIVTDHTLKDHLPLLYPTLKSYHYSTLPLNIIKIPYNVKSETTFKQS